MKAWADSKNIAGYTSEIIDRKDGDAQIPPLLLITIDSTNGTDDTALLYGHCDKQPPLTEQWTIAGPFTPLIQDDRYRSAIFSGWSCRTLSKCTTLFFFFCQAVVDAYNHIDTVMVSAETVHTCDIGLPTYSQPTFLVLTSCAQCFTSSNLIGDRALAKWIQNCIRCFYWSKRRHV